MRLQLMVRTTALAALVISAAQPAYSADITTVVSFSSAGGYSPYAGLVDDSLGNLYGTTAFGGTVGYGTVFKVSQNGTLSTLVNFTGGADGGTSFGALTRDGSGNLFGTTSRGGAFGGGTVFKISSGGTLSTLANFATGESGAPRYGLVEDAAGNFYGTTYGTGGSSHTGTVFKLSAAGALTTLAAFTGGSDGAGAQDRLVLDGSGNLFGTTQAGGASGFGTIFEITSGGSLNTLASFAGGNSGARSMAGLYLDGSGNLFGTTAFGGPYDDGTVFELPKGGVLKTLAVFNGVNGYLPQSGLITDAVGNLFGTTYGGGISEHGTVFEVSHTGVFSTLAFFRGGDGSSPSGDLYADASGNLFGTTAFGGLAGGFGTVFMVAGSGFVVPTRPVVGGVPEPTTWALMIAGFGLAGAGMRRHRAAFFA